MVDRKRPVRALLVLPALLLLAVAGGGQEDPLDLGRTLSVVQGLVANHRYQEVVDLLGPVAAEPLDAEASWAVAAELGRAHYHLAEYELAETWLERAVAIHPERVEPALYLQGSSYLAGNRERALAIFREVLRSGATDLYLAVTLCGERSFLRDPAVWMALELHSVPLDVGVAEGKFRSVRLGDQRSLVERALGVAQGQGGAGSLLARAGPKVIWALGFADDGTLAEVTVDADSLLRYTPYRLRFDNGLDWRATPAAVRAVLGSPTRTAVGDDGLLLETWELPAATLTLGFARPAAPLPLPLSEGRAALQLVGLRRSRGLATPTAGTEESPAVRPSRIPGSMPP